MKNIIVAGIGTEVGKTIAAAILTTLLNGDYWKPVQCGVDGNCDSAIMKKLLCAKKHRVHPPAYSLKMDASPHHAARMENICIDLQAIIPPETTSPLIIESVGGVYVPILTESLSIDLFKTWKCQWIVVSKHYLGSINHTLLTLDALKRHHIPVSGIIFNGEPNIDSETAILRNSRVPFFNRLLPETSINRQTIQRYAKQWQYQLPLIS